MLESVVGAETGGVSVAAAAKEASELLGDGLAGADFASEFAIWVGLDGDCDVDAFDQAKFFQNESVGVVFVGIFLDVFEGNMDGGEAAVEVVLHALDEVGLVVEDAGGFFHEVAAVFFHFGNVGAMVDEVGGYAVILGGDGLRGEAEGVGKDAVE